MPVNINLNKPKGGASAKLLAEQKNAPQVAEQEVAEEQLAEPTLNEEVDELAALLEWEAKQKKSAKMTRLKDLKKKFADLAAHEDYDPDETVTFTGLKNRLEFGKQSNSRSLKDGAIEKFANEIGEEAFIEVASIPLSAIDDYIAKKDQPDYLDYSRGSRTMKVVKDEAASK